MKVIEKIVMDYPSHNLSKCLDDIEQSVPQLSKVERVIVSLWWSNKMPRFFRPVVGMIVNKEIRE
jgi:hypothetical protein